MTCRLCPEWRCCESAWNKDPVLGVIGVQSGPPEIGVPKTIERGTRAKADRFDYIERFYNPKRRHSTLGYVSPLAS
jgi:hypothetical protein